MIKILLLVTIISLFAVACGGAEPPPTPTPTRTPLPTLTPVLVPVDVAKATIAAAVYQTIAAIPPPTAIVKTVQVVVTATPTATPKPDPTSTPIPTTVATKVPTPEPTNTPTPTLTPTPTPVFGDLKRTLSPALLDGLRKTTQRECPMPPIYNLKVEREWGGTDAKKISFPLTDATSLFVFKASPAGGGDTWDASLRLKSLTGSVNRLLPATSPGHPETLSICGADAANGSPFLVDIQGRNFDWQLSLLTVHGTVKPLPWLMDAALDYYTGCATQTARPPYTILTTWTGLSGINTGLAARQPWSVLMLEFTPNKEIWYLRGKVGSIQNYDLNNANGERIAIIPICVDTDRTIVWEHQYTGGTVKAYLLTPKR